MAGKGSSSMTVNGYVDVRAIRMPFCSVPFHSNSTPRQQAEAPAKSPIPFQGCDYRGTACDNIHPNPRIKVTTCTPWLHRRRISRPTWSARSWSASRRTIPRHSCVPPLSARPWCRLLCDRAFRRRYGAFHRAPPLLGYIHNHSISGPRFVSTATPSSLPLKAFGGCSNNGWRVIDCRHGRVLFEAVDPYRNWRNILCWVPDVSPSLVVWDSGTCEKKLLSEAPFPGRQFFNAAVICAARGCDHLDCRGGPFLVALVGYNDMARALQSHLY